jgi:hypothetical protein
MSSETCSKGHPWTEENTSFDVRGRRRCRACRRESYAKYYAEHCKRPRKTAGERLSPTVLAAIDAYCAAPAGSKQFGVVEIAKQFGVSNQSLYRALKAKGIERRKKPKRWCEWCGDDLSPQEKRFCCRECRTAFEADIRAATLAEREALGDVKRCGHCEAVLTGKKKTYCNNDCRESARRKKEAGILKSVARYCDADIPEIARILHLNENTIKAARAKIAAARKTRQQERAAA